MSCAQRHNSVERRHGLLTTYAHASSARTCQGVQPASMRHPPRDVVTVDNSAKVRGFQDTPDHGAWKKSLGSISGHFGECYGELAARLLHFPWRTQDRIPQLGHYNILRRRQMYMQHHRLKRHSLFCGPLPNSLGLFWGLLWIVLTSHAKCSMTRLP